MGVHQTFYLLDYCYEGFKQKSNMEWLYYPCNRHYHSGCCVQYKLRVSKGYEKGKGGSSENSYEAIQLIQERGGCGLNECATNMICSLTECSGEKKNRWLKSKLRPRPEDGDWSNDN